MLAFVLAAGWSLFSAPAAQAVYTERIIQIGIMHGVEKLVVKPEGSFRLLDMSAGQAHALMSLKDYKVEADGDGVIFGPYRVSGPVRIAALVAGGTLTAGTRRYRCPLVVKPNGNDTLTVIAELGVEEYLLGVLPHEMETNWPLAALKAQAVVARTFAYHNLGKYKKSGFDLTSDTRSQVYGGVGAESEAVRRAVRETRGEVLGYKGELLPAFYHACCGGHTADHSVVWGGPPAPKPLRGVKDKYCAAAPLYRWTVTIPTSDVLAALQSRRMFGGRLRAFQLGRRDPAGYVRSFEVRIGSEETTVRSGDFRAAVGGTFLRSVRLRSARMIRGGVRFDGGGSGHGVGLCQWGARLQAEKGRTYEQILDYYFPGATLSVVDE
ncbi:MAG: SpoIID/LytB domain-containing protein [Elusimicrobiota bacterium]|jgi:stage II sporulation protein D